MSIKVDMTSPDVDAQIELLKFYPEIAEKYYRPALAKDTQILHDMFLADVPLRTGKAQKALASKITGKGISLAGEVGWYGSRGQKAWYIRLIDSGTKAHEITGYGSEGRGRKGMLKFPGTSQGGNVVFTKSAQHKGISARGFTQSIWNRAQSMVTQDLAQANEAIVREMAVP